MKSELIAFANYASISTDGKLSINGIFDEIFAPSFPSQFLRGFIVFTLSKAEPETQYQLVLLMKSPDNKEVLKQETTIKTGRTGKGNFIGELVGLPLPVAGEYKVTVLYKQTVLAEMSIYVTATGGNNGTTKKTSKTTN